MSEEPTRNLPDHRSFEERLFARLDVIETRLDSMETRFDAMEARFDAMAARFDATEARFDAMEARFVAMEAQVNRRFDGLDTRIQALEGKALDTKPIWENALAEILAVRNIVEGVKDRVENIERKFDLLTIDMMQLRGDQRRLEGLFDSLSSKPA